MIHKNPIKRGKKNRTPSASELKHMCRVALLGCVVCRNEGLGFVAPQVHHLRVNPLTGNHYGLGQRAPHEHTIPLCKKHHLATSPDGYHAHPRGWAERHGSEIELYRQVCQLLKEQE